MTGPCPTCSGPIRETVGMVCQTCGTDYGPPTPERLLARLTKLGNWVAELVPMGLRRGRWSA